jgi:ubiquinone/menaquinone biosynthesis C-methylase UbiE
MTIAVLDGFDRLPGRVREKRWTDVSRSDYRDMQTAANKTITRRSRVLMSDGKVEAQKTWGVNPTGWTSAPGLVPGTAEFFEKAREFRDNFEQPWLSEVVPFASMKDKRVLEIGFGPGYDTLKFMEAGAVYSGIDITRENVERTQRHLGFFGLEPDVRQGDAEALPFPDASFDVAYSNGVLHHVPNIDKAFREAGRVLKPGGEFYVLLYHRYSVFYGLSVVLPHVLLGRFLKESLQQRRSRIEFTTADAAPIVNVYGRRELAHILKLAGFEVQSIVARKCTWADLPGSGRLGKLYRLVPDVIYHAAGRLAGWYLIAHARKV